jgi:hypothetical protein
VLSAERRRYSTIQCPIILGENAQETPGGLSCAHDLLFIQVELAGSPISVYVEIAAKEEAEVDLLNTSLRTSSTNPD